MGEALQPPGDDQSVYMYHKLLGTVGVTRRQEPERGREKLEITRGLEAWEPLHAP